MDDTREEEYTKYLLGQTAWWKRAFNVQYPYARHIRSLELGRVLEIGCGIGRNLVNLGGSPENIGVDHNDQSVAVARSRGLSAFTEEQFLKRCTELHHGFDTLLLSHVIEHMTPEVAKSVISGYLPYLKKNGRCMLVVPQQRGYRSDETHVHYYEASALISLVQSLGLSSESVYSFPFPKFFGQIFKYNETILLARNSA